MSKSHSHAAKKHLSTDDAGHRPSQQRPLQSQVLPLHAKPPTKTSVEIVSPYLAWPSFLFERMMNPWRNLESVAAWMDNWQVGGNSAGPKSQSNDTATEYRYTIELPGIERDQVSLSFQNGAIMLHAEGWRDKKTKDYRYQHLRTIRRAFTLPVYTNGSAITARLKDGVLTIIIPKSRKPVSPKSRLIAIS